MREKYKNFMKGNELLTISETLKAVTRAIFLLTTEVKIRKLIGVNREMIEETL